MFFGWLPGSSSKCSHRGSSDLGKGNPGSPRALAPRSTDGSSRTGYSGPRLVLGPVAGSTPHELNAARDHAARDQPRTRSTDVECSLACWAQLRYPHRVYSRSRWPCATPLDHLVDCCRVALDDDFHRAIGRVAHPTSHSRRSRPARARDPKADSLDEPPDDYASSYHDGVPASHASGPNHPGSVWPVTYAERRFSSHATLSSRPP